MVREFRAGAHRHVVLTFCSAMEQGQGSRATWLHSSCKTHCTSASQPAGMVNTAEGQVFMLQHIIGIIGENPCSFEEYPPVFTIPGTPP